MTTLIPKVKIELATLTDVSSVVRLASGLASKRGKDQVRFLSPPAAGNLTFELDNRSKDFSRAYTSSPYYGYLSPGKRVEFKNDTTFIFAGLTDEWPESPGREALSAGVRAIGMFSRLVGKKISIPVQTDITTDNAISLILDAADWPSGERKLGVSAANWPFGDTILRYFWLDEEDAFAAILAILAAEGPGASIYETAAGYFVLENRHYRLITARSRSSQQTLGGSELTALVPLAPFKDVVNICTCEVDEREFDPRSLVWQLDGSITLGANQIRVVRVRLSGPVAFTEISGGFNEVQTLHSTLSSNSGGNNSTFRLNFAGQQTADLDRAITAASLKTALEGLSTIGSGNVNCSGGPLNSADIAVTFQGSLGKQDLEMLTVSNVLADSGTVAITETTKGELSDSVVASGVLSSLTKTVIGGSIVDLTLDCTGSSGAVISRLAMHGRMLSVKRTIQVESQIDSSASQALYGPKPLVLSPRREIDVQTAQALVDAAVEFGQDPRSVANVEVWAPSDPSTLLAREVSDRIHLDDSQSALNGDYWIEQISASVVDGALLKMGFGCEAVSYVSPALASLRYWVMAEYGVIFDGSGGVTNWPDVSGNAADAGQATSNKRPLLVSDVMIAKPVVRGDGSNDELTVANPGWPSGGASRTVIVIVRPRVSQDKAFFGYGATGTSDHLFDVMCLSGKIGIHWWGNAVNEWSDAYAANAWIILTFVVNSGAGTITKYVNGVSKGSVSKTLNTTAGTDGVLCSGVYSTYKYFDGDLRGVLVFNAALTTAELARVHTALNGMTSIY